MKSRLLRCVFLVAAVLAGSVQLFAQLPQTRLTAVFPPGAQRGTTLEVTLTGGTDLDEVDQLVFSHAGITAAQKLDAAGKPIASVFVVSVDAAVPPGLYDVRARGLFGISNPRLFRVDSLAEAAETEPNNTAEQATAVSLNSIVNARSNGATDVDFFRVHAEAGQTLVIRSEAARIDSTMQPSLQLFNSSGRRLAESRRVFGQDASLVFTSDVAQDLLLKVSDIVYGGGNEFVYRLAVDTRPLVDAVLPATVSRTQPSRVTLLGRYLPGGSPTSMTVNGVPLQQLQVDVPAVGDGGQLAGFAAYSAPLDAFWWNAQDGNLLPMLATAQAATVAEEAPSDQTVTVPAVVAGNFAAVGDEDVYRFQAKKGETWNISVLADKLGSIADPLLMVEQVVVGADGAETFKRLATEDDDKQNPGGNDLPTLSSDPVFQLAVPEDGTYRVRLRDRYGDSRGDPRLTYHVSIRNPEPDFSLVVFDAFPSADGKAPASAGAVSLRKGGTYPVTVYAYRRDGHNTPIQVVADQLPEGITCPPVVIGPGQVSATLVLTASEATSELARPVRIVGRSGSGDQTVEHPARIATLIHDAVNGLPRTARMSDGLVVGVMKDEQPFSVQVEAVNVELSQDQQLLVPVTLKRRGGFDGKVDFTFLGVPANVDAPAFAIDKGSDTATARLFIKDNAPVSVSSIVLSGTAAVPYRRNPWLAERAAQQVKDAEAQLATRQKMAEDTAAALAAAMQSVKASDERMAVLMTSIAEAGTKQKSLRDEFVKALTAQKTAAEALEAVEQKLAAVQAAKDGSAADYDNALKAAGEAAAAAEAASAKVAELSAQARQLADGLLAAKQAEATGTAEKAAMEAKLPELKKQAEMAQAAVTAAQKVVEEATKQKAAADEAAKKANEATKPNNVNTRAVSVPLVVSIQLAPGKLTAQVPDGGAVRKGATLAIKVVLARKNNFAGPMRVALVVPAGVAGLTSDTVEIAADKTEAVVTVTAAADAAVGDVAHAVLRGTGELNGRAAAIDVPVAIKVAE